jgi:hypothetical protein
VLDVEDFTTILSPRSGTRTRWARLRPMTATAGADRESPAAAVGERISSV